MLVAIVLVSAPIAQMQSQELIPCIAAVNQSCSRISWLDNSSIHRNVPIFYDTPQIKNLQTLALKGIVPIAKLIRDISTDPNQPDRSGFTPLQLAVIKRKVTLVGMLLLNAEVEVDCATELEKQPCILLQSNARSLWLRSL